LGSALRLYNHQGLYNYPADFTLKGYLDKWTEKPVQLKIPSFQRKYVWDLVKASRLIESFLLGLPVPQVFLYKERKTNHLLVIDGQQRILSAIHFMQGVLNEKVFRLKGVASQWEGKTFTELDEAEQIQIKDSILRATVVQQLDPADNSSIYLIFERLNTGGVNLTPMEVRRCLSEGSFLDMLEELNKDQNWRKILGQQAEDKRLKDLEWVLRILALGEGWSTYQKPMKRFLTSFLIQKKKEALSTENMLEISTLFCSATSHVIKTLGAKPFHLRGRLNVSVLDACMVATMHSIKNGAPFSVQSFASLKEDKAFIAAASVSTSDEKVLRERFQLAQKYLVGV
jgi:hypothetical protein